MEAESKSVAPEDMCLSDLKSPCSSHIDSSPSFHPACILMREGTHSAREGFQSMGNGWPIMRPVAIHNFQEITANLLKGVHMHLKPYLLPSFYELVL